MYVARTEFGVPRWYVHAVPVVPNMHARFGPSLSVLIHSEYHVPQCHVARPGRASNVQSLVRCQDTGGSYDGVVSTAASAVPFCQNVGM